LWKIQFDQESRANLRKGQDNWKEVDHWEEFSFQLNVTTNPIQQQARSAL
jgi:hypothetical protein